MSGRTEQPGRWHSVRCLVAPSVALLLLGAAPVPTEDVPALLRANGARLHARYRTTETWVKREGAWKLVASQVLALRTDPPAVPTTPEQLRAYCGRYALGDLGYVVRCEADGLTGGQLGRAPKPLRLESPDVFFVPGEPRTRRIFQRDGAGRVTGFVERRESWDLFWKRVD
ncbi:MAG: hypothetical protein ACXWLF_03900 [Myxococcaceae bacterium]